MLRTQFPKCPNEIGAPGTARCPETNTNAFPFLGTLTESSSLIIAEPRWVQIPKTVQPSLALELSVAHNLGSPSEGAGMRETARVCPEPHGMARVSSWVSSPKQPLQHPLPSPRCHLAQDSEFCIFCLPHQAWSFLTARARLCSFISVAQCLAQSK